MNKKVLALLLAVTLLLGLANPSWSVAISVQPNQQLSEAFSDFDLLSSQAVRVIVELDDPPIALQRAEANQKGRPLSATQEALLQANLKSKQKNVTALAQAARLNVKEKRSYTLVYNGFSAEVPANQISRLAALPGVKAVYPDVEVFADLDNSLNTIGAPQAWETAKGYDGTGVVVAILDTGIDYMHPDLGGGFGPGFKVIGGWDFVDDDDDPMETKNMPPTPTGSARNTSHGTHVAATVAGVAPGAKLLGVRVLGPGGSGSTADVMAGIEYAVRAGAHVANMSLGSAYGHPDAPWAKAVDNAVMAGVVFCLSNGNNGPSERTTGTYANSQLAIAVGNANASPQAKIGLLETGQEIIATIVTLSPPLAGLVGGTYEFVDCGLGNSPEDFLDENGESLVDGKIALVRRGDASFAVKSRNAGAAGAIACIIANHVVDPVSPTLADRVPEDIPTLFITLAEGTALRNLNEKRITLDNHLAIVMAGGSSRGPTPLLEIKPDVSAPGTSITAAYPFPGTDGSHVPGAWQMEPGGPYYGTISGTSMAAPHVSGAAAILLQANPRWTPEQVKLALMNTAVDILQPTGRSYRPIEQGAGMISLPRALGAKLLIKPGSLNFKEVAIGATTLDLVIDALGSSNHTYNVRVDKYNPDDAYELVLPSQIRLQGKNQRIPVSLVVSPELPLSVAGQSYYCGYIYFQNVSNPLDTYRVPFHFVNGQVISQVTATPIYFSPNGDGVLDTTTLSFVVGRPVNDVRFSVSAGGFHNFFGNTGPLQPGHHSIEWDASVPSGRYVPDGSHTIHAHYQLAPGDPWVNIYSAGNIGTPSFARLFIDRYPPDLYHVRPVIMPERRNHVTIQGNVDDLCLGSLMGEGGWIFINDREAAYIMSQRNPDTGWDWGFFESHRLEADLNAMNTYVVRALDKAGNETTVEHNFTGLVVNGPNTVETGAETFLVSGRVVSGMSLLINGVAVEYDISGEFAHAVELTEGTNTITVSAGVPAWRNFRPIVQAIQVVKTQP